MAGQRGKQGRRAESAHPWQADPMRPRVERAVAGILAVGKEVAPVDVLARMDLLRDGDLDRWRRGQVPYLESVLRSNLTRLSRLLRVLRWHAHDLRLVPRVVIYRRLGKGKGPPLRFTKTGDRKLEEAYARHFLWPGKGPFHPPGEV